jgi:hypothetical protein
MTMLKRTDIKLLADALASNGGGVRDERYKDATVNRLIRAGLLQLKPGQRTIHTTLLTITKAGEKALAGYTPPPDTRSDWRNLDRKPKYVGEYEGKEKDTGLRLVVYWRQLDDTPAPDWYFDKGNLGPFKLWESARERITAWRHPR